MPDTNDDADFNALFEEVEAAKKGGVPPPVAKKPPADDREDLGTRLSAPPAKRPITYEMDAKERKAANAGVPAPAAVMPTGTQPIRRRDGVQPNASAVPTPQSTWPAPGSGMGDLRRQEDRPYAGTRAQGITDALNQSSGGKWSASVEGPEFSGAVPITPKTPKSADPGRVWLAENIEDPVKKGAVAVRDEGRAAGAAFVEGGQAEATARAAEKTRELRSQAEIMAVRDARRGPGGVQGLQGMAPAPQAPIDGYVPQGPSGALDRLDVSGKTPGGRALAPSAAVQAQLDRMDKAVAFITSEAAGDRRLTPTAAALLAKKNPGALLAGYDALTRK